MKKTTQICILLSLISGEVFGLSIVYRGQSCQHSMSDPLTNQTTLNNPIESRFEVIEDNGNGMFRLRLTGGLAVFVVRRNCSAADPECTTQIHGCVDIGNGIGDEVITENKNQPVAPDVSTVVTPKQSNEAIGYFNGQQLVISIHSLHALSNQKGAINSEDNTFSSSWVNPIANTLIFKYIPETSSFKLEQIIQKKGTVFSTGNTTPTDKYLAEIITMEEGIPLYNFDIPVEYKIE